MQYGAVHSATYRQLHVKAGWRTPMVLISRSGAERSWVRRSKVEAEWDPVQAQQANSYRSG